MTRMLGPILFTLLMLAMLGLRYCAFRDATRMTESERHALATVDRIRQASERLLVQGGPHPGLGGLGPVSKDLRLLEAEVPERTYARDDSYVYGIHTTSSRNEEGETVYGFVLRAWPWKFGVTGNIEYVLQDGQLWESRNRIGRSGTTVGFPPTFPEPAVDQPGSSWRHVRSLPTHR